MSTHGKTRLSCRIARLRDAMTGSHARGHTAHCADCQAYYRATDSLIDQLRAAAPRTTPPATDELAARIARAVRETAPARRTPRRSRALETFAVLAGAAAVFAFSFHLVRQNNAAPAGKTTTIATSNSAELTALVAGVDSLRTRLLASVEPAAETIATENPLSRELDSMQADARSAIGFLAMNFLPSASAQALETRLDPNRI